MRSAVSWFERLGRTRQILAIAGAAALVVLLAAAAWLVGVPGAMDFADGRKVALADYPGADPTGVPAALAGAGLVERGEYLARAADCVVCHTGPGGVPYAGGFAFTLPFGTIYSTNITPDEETGIGQYTDAQFLAAVQRGVGRHGEGLYPAMPYTSYGYMTDADILAIKAYLLTLEPVRAPSPEARLAFPFNQRWLMHVWSAMFAPHKGFMPNAEKSAEWNRGAYLAEALAHCGECHTPRNLVFAIDNRAKFKGAVAAGWRAYNITQDRKTGIGDWSEADLLSYLSTGHAPGRGTASGPMGEAIDESFSLLAPEDRRALVAYVRSVPAKSSALPASLAPAAPASHRLGAETADALGKTLFEGACVSCHAWTGEGTLSPLATLTGARAVNDPSAINVVQAIVSGDHRAAAGGIISMPAFGGAYSDTEIAALANYVTARFGAAPSRVTEKDVASLRRQAGG
ncbi:MAG: cytochrome c [Alphaproteobacteria bacterium]|nr:cytochrome c [Alphaproteobacteria bacterium]